jgi:hypothetical protein
MQAPILPASRVWELSLMVQVHTQAVQRLSSDALILKGCFCKNDMLSCSWKNFIMVFNKNALVADSQESAHGGDAWLQHRPGGKSQETISKTATVR